MVGSKNQIPLEAGGEGRVCLEAEAVEVLESWGEGALRKGEDPARRNRGGAVYFADPWELRKGGSAKGRGWCGSSFSGGNCFPEAGRLGQSCRTAWIFAPNADLSVGGRKGEGEVLV